MAKGSFAGLYTFDEVAKIYDMTQSNLRKMVQYDKFVIDKEIKKFGKTWLITEEAIREHFGDDIDDYFKNIKLAELQAAREAKIQNKMVAKTKKNDVVDMSCNADDEVVSELTYIEVDPNSVVSSFNFSD